MNSDKTALKMVVEALLMSAGRPLPLDQLHALVNQVPEQLAVKMTELKLALTELGDDYKTRSIELCLLAKGYRFQAKPDYRKWLTGLWEEKPSKYSRALLETLAIIAYRQPVTRADIEDIRGVAVSSNMIKTLLEREWINVVGHRDVPGKPAIYATTKSFLDYFNLKRLDELPALEALKSIESLLAKDEALAKPNNTGENELVCLETQQDENLGVEAPDKIEVVE